MVPTEILARQHLATLSKLAPHAGLRLGLLTGREKGSARDDGCWPHWRQATSTSSSAPTRFFRMMWCSRIWASWSSTSSTALVCTSAWPCRRKAEQTPDLLVMTATPIPRTLALTVYGDMDVSKLTEKPAGRQPIDTRVMPLSRMDDVVTGLARSLSQGVRAYWVCPLVEESELVDMAAAEDRFNALATTSSRARSVWSMAA